MLSGTKSIFNLGENANPSTKGTTSRGIKNSKTLPESVEGLRIIIKHQDHQHSSNIVIKSSLRSTRVVSRPCPLTNTSPELTFLKACFLCKKELKPHMDVFMYRGDLGFCSEVCRHHQILLDERREYEALVRRRSKVHHHRGSSKAHGSAQRTRTSVLA